MGPGVTGITIIKPVITGKGKMPNFSTDLTYGSVAMRASTTTATIVAASLRKGAPTGVVGIGRATSTAAVSGRALLNKMSSAE